MHKVCVITDVHWILDTRINKEIRTLVKAGYDVSYVAPATPEEVKKFSELNPDVKVFPINRYESRRKRMTKGVREAYKAALSTEAKIYHFHDPELIEVGILLKFRGKKVIYDVHENYVADIMSKEWIPKYVRFLYSFSYFIVEKLTSIIFDGIIVVIPDLVKKFNKRKTILLPNYPLIEPFVILKKSSENSKNFLIGHLGGLSNIRNIRNLLKAFEISVNISKNMNILFIGPVEDIDLKNDIFEMQRRYPNNFTYLSRKPYKEALQIMKNCDAGIAVFKPLPNTSNSSPNKLFEYMALGLPIIASDFPKWHEVLDEAKCAVYVNPMNVEDIAEKMVFLSQNRKLAQQMGERGKKLVFEKYNWSVIEKRLLELYSRILKR